MSAAASILTNNAARLLKRPLLDQNALKTAMQDSSWADVRLSNHIWAPYATKSRLIDLSLYLGPPRHCFHLRRVQSHGALFCTATGLSLLWR